MLRHAVTLTFDSLTLNVCIVSALTRSNFFYRILAKSNHPRWSYCDFNMSPLCAVRHFRFDRKWIFHDSAASENTHKASTYQTSAKSYNAPLSYWWWFKKYLGPFSGEGQIADCMPSFRCTERCQIWGGHDVIS